MTSKCFSEIYALFNEENFGAGRHLLFGWFCQSAGVI